jgi:hypothetical protein
VKRTAMRVVSSSLDVCADVGMDRLNLVCLPLSRPGAVAEWDIENRSEAITETLTAIKQLAASHGHEQVRVVVEPTGVYHAHFLNIARRLDFELAFVNPEHVEKMRHVIFGMEASRMSEIHTPSPRSPLRVVPSSSGHSPTPTSFSATGAGCTASPRPRSSRRRAASIAYSSSSSPTSTSPPTSSTGRRAARSCAAFTSTRTGSPR